MKYVHVIHIQTCSENLYIEPRCNILYKDDILSIRNCLDTDLFVIIIPEWILQSNMSISLLSDNLWNITHTCRQDRIVLCCVSKVYMILVLTEIDGYWVVYPRSLVGKDMGTSMQMYEVQNLLVTCWRLEAVAKQCFSVMTAVSLPTNKHGQIRHNYSIFICFCLHQNYLYTKGSSLF